MRSRSVLIRSRRCDSLRPPLNCHHVPPWRACAHNCSLATYIYPHPTPAHTRTRALARDHTRAERRRPRAHTHIAARAANSPVWRLRSARQHLSALMRSASRSTRFCHGISQKFPQGPPPSETRTVGPTRVSGGPPCRPLRSFPSDPFKFESGGSTSLVPKSGRTGLWLARISKSKEPGPQFPQPRVASLVLPGSLPSIF